MSTVLVTGATGTLGRVVVATLLAAGHEVRAMSRSEHDGAGTARWVSADLATGRGVAAAVDGTDAVVHLAAAPYRRGYTSQVEIDGTGRLAAAARAAGTQHLVYTSIVGADRVPWGYYRTKVAGEEVVTSYGVGWTVLRATQFFDLLDGAFRALTRLPVVPVDRTIRAQPVDTSDVAQRVATLLDEGPTGRVVELGGPEVLDGDGALRQWMAVLGRRRRIVPVRGPGPMLAAFRAGHATTRARPTGTVTWSEYLNRRYGQPGPG